MQCEPCTRLLQHRSSLVCCSVFSGGGTAPPKVPKATRISNWAPSLHRVSPWASTTVALVPPFSVLSAVHPVALYTLSQAPPHCKRRETDVGLRQCAACPRTSKRQGMEPVTENMTGHLTGRSREPVR
jgi:hypothetical protein